MGKRKKARRQGSFSRTWNKATVVSPEPDQQVLAKADPSPLTYLPFPPEIRDRIYTHVLYSATCVLVGDEIKRFYVNSEPANEFLLSALLLSRRTYIEAFHIFYKINTFSFTSTDVL